MGPPSNDTGLVARLTPDGRRGRRLLAGVAAIAAPLALYGTAAVVTSTNSGTVYDLLVAVLGIATLALPAIAAAALYAPDAPLGGDSSEAAVEQLKQRYSNGEIDDTEFDRRMERLIAVESRQSDTADSRQTNTADSRQTNTADSRQTNTADSHQTDTTDDARRELERAE